MREFFFIPIGYAQVFKNRIKLSIPVKGIVVEEFGEFSHPRSLIGQFEVGEKAMAKAISRAYPGKLIKPRPFLVIHPKEILEGGLTQIEERALMEMGLGAGASRVKVWQGADLDTEQLDELIKS
jgi:rod shape-determining protein MreB